MFTGAFLRTMLIFDHAARNATSDYHSPSFPRQFFLSPRSMEYSVRAGRANAELAATSLCHRDIAASLVYSHKLILAPALVTSESGIFSTSATPLP
jgi:hypothetical protein